MNPDRDAQIAAFIGRVDPFLTAMLADMQFVGSVPRTPNNACAWDRANVRTFFSVLDALSNFLRSQALFLRDLGWKGLDSDLLNRLQPQARLTLKENVKVSLNAIAAVRNPRLMPLDFGRSPEWGKLVEAESVRDRIIHPKSETDLTITAAECAVFNAAVLWYFRTLVDCLALERPPWLQNFGDAQRT